MLIIVPTDGRIVDANRAAVRFYGYPARMLKSMRISDINLLDERSLRAKMTQAAREEKRHFRFRHRVAGGAVRDVEVASGPILSGAGNCCTPSSATSRNAGGSRMPSRQPETAGASSMPSRVLRVV
jgi:PAS domain S-box-containing protein